jgi:pyruvate dehydrogenase kinase 2/3/4
LKDSLVCDRVAYVIMSSSKFRSIRFTTNSTIEEDIMTYASRSQTLVSLRNLVEVGSGEKLRDFEKFLPPKSILDLPADRRVMILVACFLHREITIRLAHRARELDAIPQFRQASHVQHICNMYKLSFSEIKSLPIPSDAEKEELFSRGIQKVYDRHATLLVNMAKGAYEIRLQLLKEHNRKHGTPFNDKLDLFADQNLDLQKRLNDFYASRISIRLLVAQYLALRDASLSSSKNPEFIGLIHTRASPRDIAMLAVENASYVCNRAYGDCPSVTILGRTDLVFPYIPSHLEYILVELLKNSMRATIEKHGIDSMPPIKIVIADGEGMI